MAADASTMCDALVQKPGFRERLQSIPIYPDMFCRCVVESTYQDDGGRNSKPYGTYAPQSYDRQRSAFLLEVQSCLR